ncbi:DUF6282 family protein [uncultured Jatrophihabitans sp.]|uniref:DUF6282 family protein n=1 Tax=uncultured Jatrophihabitans sp. TaxID=1610747 RepID=UPI0035CC6E4E
MAVALTRGAPTGVVVDGAVDLHCHFGPEPLIERAVGTPHSVDPLEAARDALAAGMSAIVLKGHEFPTATLARTVGQLVPGLQVVGGICCDTHVGGLNPAAVEVALNAGARVVWLPTISAADNNPFLRRVRGAGIRTVDADGRLRPEVLEIMALVSDHDAVLATGHISAAEQFAVTREFAHRGKVVVTHAMQRGVGPEFTTPDCVALAELGAVIEFSAHSCVGVPAVFDAVVGALGALDPRRVVLSTDYGWTTDAPRPAPGLRGYLEALWAEGVDERLLTEFVRETPARLLARA